MNNDDDKLRQGIDPTQNPTDRASAEPPFIEPDPEPVSNEVGEFEELLAVIAELKDEDTIVNHIDITEGMQTSAFRVDRVVLSRDLRVLFARTGGFAPMILSVAATSAAVEGLRAPDLAAFRSVQTYVRMGGVNQGHGAREQTGASHQMRWIAGLSIVRQASAAVTDGASTPGTSNATGMHANRGTNARRVAAAYLAMRSIAGIRRPAKQERNARLMASIACHWIRWIADPTFVSRGHGVVAAANAFRRTG